MPETTKNSRPKTGTKAGIPKPDYPDNKKDDLLVRGQKPPPLPVLETDALEIDLDSNGDSNRTAKPAMPVFKRGDKVGDRVLLGRESSGGMGEVWRVRENKTGGTSRCAIKFFLPNDKDPNFLQRYKNEAAITAYLQHKNIVAVRDTGMHGQIPYIAFTYYEGKTLAQVISDAPMEVGRVMALTWPVLQALAFAHEKGVIHRDIKPDNIFLTTQGEIILLDFGVARFLKKASPFDGPSRETKRFMAAARKAMEDPSTTANGRLPSILDPESVYQTFEGLLMIGTPGYMPCEQWTGGATDERSDIFSLGILLWLCLAGRHPFAEFKASRYRIMAQESIKVPRLSTAIPNIDPRLDQAVARCTEPDINLRYPSVKALMADLAPFLPSPSIISIRDDRCPWVGLGAYQEADADLFYGRDAVIASLSQLIRERGLVAIVAPSGHGKTSLVLAGVIPKLKRAGEGWVSLAFRPGVHPMEALVNAVMAMMEPGTYNSKTTLVEHCTQAQELKIQLQAEPAFIASAVQKHCEKEGVSALLFVDNFEDLFTLANPEEKTPFFRCLFSIASSSISHGRVVIAMRPEFLDRLALEAPELMAELSLGGLQSLPLPNRDDLRDAIKLPAKRLGYTFEKKSIVEDMLDHLENSGVALSMLQATLAPMWEKRDGDKKWFSEKCYQEIGGIPGAFCAHADRAIEQLSPAGQLIASKILPRLVNRNEDDTLIPAGVPVDELREVFQTYQQKDQLTVEQIVDHLVKARLAIIQQHEDSRLMVELSHGSLIQNWTTLQRWLSKNQNDFSFLNELRSAVKLWETKQRSTLYLWHNPEQINEAKQFIQRNPSSLTSLQSDFLNAVFHRRDKAVKRRRAMMVGAVFGLSTLSVAAIAGSVIVAKSEIKASIQIHEAHKARIQANTSQKEAKRQAKVALMSEQKVLQKEMELAKAAEKLREVAFALEQKNRELLDALDREKMARRGAHRNSQEAIMAQSRVENLSRQISGLLQAQRTINDQINSKYSAVASLKFSNDRQSR